MRSGKIYLLILFALFQGIFSYSQDSTSRDTTNSRLKVSVFTPLYLDSAFDASGSYRYEKYFPKFINPGLEFYEGVQLALDSLEKEGAKRRPKSKPRN